FVFPEPSSLILEDKNSDLFKLAEQFADRVLYRSGSGRWFVKDTLIEARNSLKISEFEKKLLFFSYRLKKGKASRYPLAKVISKCILSAYTYALRIQEGFELEYLYDINLFNEIDGVLCDITAEGKFVNETLRGKLRNVTKFSMLHGLEAVWMNKNFLCKKTVKKRSDIVVYSNSYLEFDGYKRCFGVLKNSISHVGIVRHDKDWIRFLCDNLKEENTGELFDSFVLIIGSPASPHNPPERKRKVLRNIYDIAYVKYGIKLVIKPHPKEDRYGFDGDIYSNALNIENYGKAWMYSDKNPFILGKKVVFVCTFGSGVSLDMLFINKPTIDCADLRGLELYDTESSLRNESGNPVFGNSYAKFTLNACSRPELELHVKSILTKYEETVELLRSNYDSYFGVFNGSSGIVANDICRRVYADKL
ncbi:hypothetical protein HOL24_02940, partial [bacterium]|nr:hypothetical protein [bacterium]